MAIKTYLSFVLREKRITTHTNWIFPELPVWHGPDRYFVTETTPIVTDYHWRVAMETYLFLTRTLDQHFRAWLKNNKEARQVYWTRDSTRRALAKIQTIQRRRVYRSMQTNTGSYPIPRYGIGYDLPRGYIHTSEGQAGAVTAFTEMCRHISEVEDSQFKKALVWFKNYISK